jgi:hypothetical protein
MTMPTMGDAERRAIVWDTIERMAFRPTSDPDRRAWLEIYARALPGLWEMEHENVRVHKDDGRSMAVSILFHEVEYECSIKKCDEYSVTMLRNNAAFWHLHVDPCFPSRCGYGQSSTKCHQQDKGKAGESTKYPREDKAKHLEGDVEVVLNGMIFHPRNHAHAEDLGISWPASPANTMLSTHEVRLGGGIENAFVFLAHLRYQFYLLSEAARSEERRRLERLFVQSIRSRKESIPPKDVLNPRY